MSQPSQLSLGRIHGAFMTKRPSSHDEKIDTLIAEELLDDVIGWLKASGDEDPDRDEVRKSLESAMDFEDDGYKIARQLDNDGWDVDAELVHILDNAFPNRIRIHRDFVAKWVEENGIKPTFEVGQTVAFKERNKSHTGEITRINEKQAEYTIYCAEMGHVREGTGSHGVILPFEAVSIPEESVEPCPTT